MIKLSNIQNTQKYDMARFHLQLLCYAYSCQLIVENKLIRQPFEATKRVRGKFHL